MSYITTKQVLDNVQTIIQDNSSALRTKMLTWVNNIYQRTALAFPWNCLLKTSTISITANVLTLPSDFREVDNILVGTYTLTPNDEVTDQENYLWANGGTVPIGYTVGSTTLTFVPGTAAANCSFRYIQEVPTYSDNTSATLFTLKFLPLFERTLLDTYYEYDADERVAGRTSIPLNGELLKALLISEIRSPSTLAKYKRYIDSIGVDVNGSAS